MASPVWAISRTSSFAAAGRWRCLSTMHERRDELRSDFPAVTTEFRDHVIMWSKDVQRTVDYLETRGDIAPDKIGFLGRSWGGAMGTIMVATEPRFKLAIFHVGGFYFQRARPEVEAINFAPRVRVPSLMLNGRYDFFFPVETSQRHMFQLIGVPERQNACRSTDTSHGLPRGETVKETLAWLDKVLRARAVEVTPNSGQAFRPAPAWQG